MKFSSLLVLIFVCSPPLYAFPDAETPGFQINRSERMVLRERIARRPFFYTCAAGIMGAVAGIYGRPYLNGIVGKPTIFPESEDVYIISPLSLKLGQIDLIPVKRLLPGRVYMVVGQHSGQLQRAIETDEGIQMDGIGIPSGSLLKGKEIWLNGDEEEKMFRFEIMGMDNFRFVPVRTN